MSLSRLLYHHSKYEQNWKHWVDHILPAQKWLLTGCWFNKTRTIQCYRILELAEVNDLTVEH